MATCPWRRGPELFASLAPWPEDPVLRIMGEFAADPRPGKVDLGVGVWRDAQGRTPVMAAVREAGRRILAAETTKGYTTLAGDPAFGAAMADLVLGPGGAARAAVVGTPGGTGAVRQGLELVRMAAPGARVWVSDPTWPNHVSILHHLGIAHATYAWLDPAGGGIALDRLLADLGRAAPGDAVLLHGCCHNPTGANPTADEWQAIIALIAEGGLLPFVDLAYQGLGDGLEEDAAATRALAASCPEVLIAASCSKTFGIYRERAGALIALAGPDRRGLVQGNLIHLNRQNYSFPPDHGARLVTTVLADPALRRDWQAELEGMRLAMLALRQGLAEALRRATNSDRFDFLTRHRGMFSRLGLTAGQVARLRAGHAVYMVADSRINIAGLATASLPAVAQAVASVLD